MDFQVLARCNVHVDKIVIDIWSLELWYRRWRTNDSVQSSRDLHGAVSCTSIALIPFRILQSFLCWICQSWFWQVLPQYTARLHPAHLLRWLDGKKHRKQRCHLIARMGKDGISMLCSTMIDSLFMMFEDILLSTLCWEYTLRCPTQTDNTYG